MDDSRSIRRGAETHLLWGGASTVDLARQFGTPLYLMDTGLIKSQMQRYLESGRKSYGDLRIAYAGKAFLVGAVIKLAQETGLWLDVASGGEIDVALRAGFPSERLIFHGNNKTEADLRLALVSEVGRVVIDNIEEMDRLNRLAQRMGKRPKVKIRVTPGISPSTHRATQTGQVDSKFGLLIADGSARSAFIRALSREHLDPVGIHCHIGSQISQLAPFRAAASTMARLAWDIWAETGFLCPEVNLGGGWAARYLPQDDLPPLEDYLQAILKAFTRSWRRHGTPGVPLGQGVKAASGNGRRYSWPSLYLEPGRSLVSEAGLTLYTVGSVKRAGDHVPYVLVDGGMADNPRVALYGARYHTVLANRVEEEPEGVFRVAGNSCESDILISGVQMPTPREDDILAVYSTGAYNYSMASNYNRFPRPPVVFVERGNAQLVVRRETTADMSACDLGLKTPSPKL